MSFLSKDFDLPKNMFFFHNTELDQLTFVLKSDTKDKFYLRLINVSIVKWFYEHVR